MTTRRKIATAAACILVFAAAFGAGSVTRSDDPVAPARAPAPAPGGEPVEAPTLGSAARLPDLRVPPPPERTPESTPAPAAPSVPVAASARVSAPAPAAQAPAPAPAEPAEPPPDPPAPSTDSGDQFFDGG
jgi:hypothetical protein